jgi:hypothetical protein
MPETPNTNPNRGARRRIPLGSPRRPSRCAYATILDGCDCEEIVAHQGPRPAARTS